MWIESALEKIVPKIAFDPKCCVAFCDGEEAERSSWRRLSPFDHVVVEVKALGYCLQLEDTREIPMQSGSNLRLRYSVRQREIMWLLKIIQTLSQFSPHSRPKSPPPHRALTPTSVLSFEMGFVSLSSPPMGIAPISQVQLFSACAFFGYLMDAGLGVGWTRGCETGSRGRTD